MVRLIWNQPETRATVVRLTLPRVSRTCRQTVSMAKRVVPRDTGRLANSIGSKISTPRYAVKGRVGTRVSYARPLHNGSQAHKIRAVRARALKFYWKRVGHVVFFASVRHPGNKAVPFLTAPLSVAARDNGFRYRRLVANTVR